jgi:hypothetical protein
VTEAPAASATGGETPTFDLLHEPDGRSWTARENLVDLLERQLLGPLRGEDEVVEDPPDTLYLVGRIAPVRLTGAHVANETEAEEEADIGDDLAARDQRGVPVASDEEAGTAGDEDGDQLEDAPQRRGLMIPASMGLRFQVPRDLPEVTVHASWGTYNPFRSDKTTASGTPIRHFRRTHHDVPVRVPVAALSTERTHEFPVEDDVVLRVDVMDEGDRRLVEVALCNDREVARPIPVNAWLYQTKLSVDAGGAAVFLPVRDALVDDVPEPDPELRRLRLQYRDRLEFAHGRICSADWAQAPGERRATAVWTTWLPTSETPQTRAVEIDEAILDMRALAEADTAMLDAGLRPIVDQYAGWLDDQETRARQLPDHLRADALEAVQVARLVAKQLRTGLEYLLADEEAQRCFRFMNAVMADQRVQTQVAELRAREPRLGREEARRQVLGKGPAAHSWRTFQLAFVLMQIESIGRPTTPRRSGENAKVELIFFPTGGGKTEAYLGLAAFTFAMRRRQGLLETPDGPVDGRSGVAVLMRYTLRLLTSQQFQRATALVCAAELARRADPEVWGEEPFRIGLWVGTDVSPKRVSEAAKELERVNEGHGYRLTVLQIQRCPWCGDKVGAKDVRVDTTAGRVYVRCGDQEGECPFSEGGSVPEGIPVLTVDEEIYRLTPSFVIATVDKFARLAREGQAAALFGYVRRRCERHGYVHEDDQGCTVTEMHPAKDGLPRAYVRPVSRLRPPDLIIQDELHLITGALGTTVGLFEAAIDVLCTWRDASGAQVRPLIVASSATVRNAPDQVKALYGRNLTVFPPQVLDAGRTFFSEEVPVTKESPGRRYVGVSTTGVRLTAAEIRLAEVLMAGAQLMLDTSGDCADPYMTLVGYFNATRELAGMARYLADDVQTALSKGRRWTGIPRRLGTDYGSLHVAELTSRIASSAITSTLDEMSRTFSAAYDSTEAKLELARRRLQGEKVPTRPENPFDVVLATSMLQVGVDVSRLGLMMVVGQPKNTAEYIQASSRVGRSADRPGLVVTLGNWARPRDLAHFEQFRHYHETFYAQVEALSVTPFSVTSLDRGVAGMLVATARVLHATQQDGLSGEKSAGRVASHWSSLEAITSRLVERIREAGGDPAATAASARFASLLGNWKKRRDVVTAQHLSLVYERATEGKEKALLISPENAVADPSTGEDPPFQVPNSMREVQPEINLLVSPLKDRLFTEATTRGPAWELDEGGAE